MSKKLYKLEQNEFGKVKGDWQLTDINLKLQMKAFPLHIFHCPIIKHVMSLSNLLVYLQIISLPVKFVLSWDNTPTYINFKESNKGVAVPCQTKIVYQKSWQYTIN